MKRRIPLIPVFVLIILACTQCTVEKRLYNRGFHVEYRGKQNSEVCHHKKETADIERAVMDEVKLEYVETITRDSVATSSSYTKDSIEITTETTILPRHPKEPYTDVVRKDKLISSSCLTALFGGMSYLCYLGFQSAPTLLSALGTFLGWYGFMGVAIICGIAFLIYLVRPTVEDQERKMSTDPTDRKFSKGERVGLIVAGIFAFVILIAFLSSLIA